MTISEIAGRIKQRQPKHTPVIIGVEGLVGAGKSTLAAKLKVELDDAYVIAIDDFFLKNKMREDNESNLDRIDRKRLENQVLLPIRKGQPAAYQKLEYATNTLSQFIEVLAVKYLIIEGISAFHPGIVHYMDYKIWVETPKEMADTRGVKRDKELGEYEDGLWEHLTETYQDYKDLHHPEDLADFTFDNSQASGC